MFNKLDNIVTPHRLFKLFFDDVLVGMTVGYTKLYSHREKADISFETTNKKLWLFLTMLVLSGYHRFQATPDPDTRSDSMHRNTSEHILRNLYHCDNEELDK